MQITMSNIIDGNFEQADKDYAEMQKLIKEHEAALRLSIGTEQEWRRQFFISSKRIESLESELAKYKDQDKGATLLSLANEEIGKLIEENKRLQSELLLRDITMLPEKDREIDELKAENTRLKEQIERFKNPIKDAPF